MNTIKLHTHGGSQTEICFSSDMAEVKNLLDELQNAKRRLIAIIDQNVEQKYGQLFDLEKIIINADEQDKTMNTVSRVVESLLELQAGKELFLIGIGGGITTDICGFVASIFKRGVDFAFIPTTLLAMIDASIGGKNGVNVLDCKNMIGCIKQPRWVYINPLFLNTLPDRLSRCGVAEMLKVFLIDGEDYRAAISYFTDNQSISSILQDATKFYQLKQFMEKAIQIKCRFVVKDEFDHSERQLLNLGHTFAHAIEFCSRAYLHGEAVSAGILLSAKLTNELLFNTLRKDFANCGLPTELPQDCNQEAMLNAILNDKKNNGNQVTMIQILDIGKVSALSINTDTLHRLFCHNLC